MTRVRRFRFDPAALADPDPSDASEPAPATAEPPRVARIDRFLAACDPDLSRSQIQRLIEEGRVSVGDAAVTRASHKLRPGDEITVAVPDPVEPRAVAQDIPLDVLFEDRHLIVVDKPAGLVVHPGPGHPDGTLVNALLARCETLSGVGGVLRPGIVHRLDKDTSGVMVASKDDITHAALAAAFAAHALDREYLAVVAPPPRDLVGTFSTLHGRHPTHRKKFSSRVRAGKTAITHYAVEQRFGDLAARVRCRLETGRTHQIRVHFSDHGSPVLGDPLYGRRHRGSPLADLAAALGRQALHAAVLAFTHPITGERLRFATEPPADMQRLLRALAGS